MIGMRLAAMGLAAMLTMAASACAQTTPAPTTPNDYAKPESWLCLPGRQDACASDQTTTIVEADGKTSIETFKAASAPAYDCFYVYPTVSTDPGEPAS